MVHIPLNRHFISWCILICLTCGFYTTTLFASPDYWPTKGWRSSTPEEQGMDSGKLIEMMEMVRDDGLVITDFATLTIEMDGRDATNWSYSSEGANCEA